MIQIVGKKLTQWDVDRVIKVTGDVSHVHFANQGDSKAVVKEVKDGEVQIPTFLLQTGKTLLAYAVKDGRTLECKAFAVRKRERPADYIYEDDQRNYIYKLIDEVNEAIDNANKAAEELREAIENGEIDVTGTVKTVNGIEPDENGNVEIEGGGASVMIVSCQNGDQSLCSPSQIFAHVQAGGMAVFQDGGSFVALSYVDPDIAIFAEINDDYCHYAHVIDDGGNYEHIEMNHASIDYVESKVGNIAEALDHIIQLQEELINL